MEINKILIIIRRSNGDVFLSEPLIRELKEKTNAKIDILINKNTYSIAKTIPYINKIYVFDYSWKGLKKFIEPIKLFWKIFKKYDISINLTSLKFLNLYPNKITIKSYYNNKLLKLLNTLNIPIIITGGKSRLDSKIANEIPNLKNIYNLIGETTLEEFIALSDMSIAYIGMDTLNMHIAASQNKYVFAIFGPTFHKIWSPWSNICECYAKINTKPLTIYKNIYLFQANMNCVPCGKAECDDKGGKSKCLYNIESEFIFQKVKECLLK